MGYQDVHWEIVDYQGYILKDTDLWFRGPEPKNLKAGEYFVCLGAAQTYGCFCEKPYPAILQDNLNLQALNLGYSGAGPYFFLKQEKLWDYINSAKFAVIQVMSGRSESNSVFESGGLEYLIRRSDGVQIGAEAAYRTLLEGDYEPGSIALVQKWSRKALGFFKVNREVEQIITETRQNWIHHYQQLLEKIKAPKILFWFSKRKPYYRERYHSTWRLFGDFPQLVNAEMVNAIKSHCNDYVECVSNRGSPQLLISRFTGQPVIVDLSLDPDRNDFTDKWRHNSYYPSPEMHIDAATLLEPLCRKYL